MLEATIPVLTRCGYLILGCCIQRVVSLCGMVGGELGK